MPEAQLESAAKRVVFVVDDDPVVRKSLRWLLESPEIDVEEFPSAEQFLGEFRDERPGCLVLDVRMPQMSGIELQDCLNNALVKLPIIMLTGHGNVSMAVQAMQAGAYSFLEKPAHHQQLRDSVLAAIELDAQRRYEDASARESHRRLLNLTVRERDVLNCIVAGMSTKRIVRELDITQQSVARHRGRILEKMDVENDVELTRVVEAIERRQDASRRPSSA